MINTVTETVPTIEAGAGTGSLQIRMILDTIGHDPQLMFELLQADDARRSELLAQRGFVLGDGEGPSRDEVFAQIQTLLVSPTNHASPDRAVEWVAAIGTAAAGAAAGACFGE